MLPASRALPDRSPIDVRPLVAATWLTAVAAWIALVVWSTGPAAPLLDHTDAVGPLGATALSAGWLLMVLAMMLPLATRLLVDVARLVATREQRVRLLALAAAGVMLPWLAVGQFLQIGDIVLHGVLDPLRLPDGVVFGVVLAFAGAMQFSSLKQRCLTNCRSPIGFAAQHWRGVHPGWEIFRVGSAYGTSCVGCCVALMVVAFAVGMSSIVPMLVLAVLMAAERWVTHGVRLAHRAGVVMMGLGAAIVVGSLAG